MMKWIAAAALAVSSVAIASAQSAAPFDRDRLGIPKGRKNGTFPGYIVVKYAPSVADELEKQSQDVSATRAPVNAQFLRRIPETGWTLWQFPTILKFETIRNQFRNDPRVLYTQPLNKVYTLWTEPNDLDWNVDETDESIILNFGESELSFKRLWHLDDISAVGGWMTYPNRWYSSSSMATNAPVIAVIDTGCDMDHPDFINAGGTGTDTTLGGQFMKSRSKQFDFGEVKVGGSPNDKNGHGTHVTGLALAAGNNGGFSGHGVVGTGYGCRGMILRVFDDSGNGSDFDAAGAMYYAAQYKAHVINLSLGTENFSQLFQDATTYAFQSGSLVVAAGNEDGSGGGDLGPIYPAACSGALAVTANGPGQVPATATYSGTGYYVDIAAPGGDLVQGEDYFIIQFIWSTAMRTAGELEELSNQGAVFPPYTRNYSYLAGTSMACPQVSGAAGMYFAKNNRTRTYWANLQGYRALQRSADGVMGAPHGGWEPYQGYGSLNMDSLLNDVDSRGSDAGGIEGIVYSNGTPVPNVSVSAKKLNGTFTFKTTTKADGSYRFDVMPPGQYSVTAAPFGQKKIRLGEILAGSDLTGHDFWCGTFTGDETAPTIGGFEIVKVNHTNIKIKNWAYDTETGIDSIKVRIGTTKTGAQVLGDQVLPWSVTSSTLTGFTLVPGATYYMRGSFTNGAGQVVTQVLTFKGV